MIWRTLWQPQIVNYTDVRGKTWAERTVLALVSVLRGTHRPSDLVSIGFVRAACWHRVWQGHSVTRAKETGHMSPISVLVSTLPPPPLFAIYFLFPTSFSVFIFFLFCIPYFFLHFSNICFSLCISFHFILLSRMLIIIYIYIYNMGLEVAGTRPDEVKF
jgi:hypothetical protein